MSNPRLSLRQKPKIALQIENMTYPDIKKLFSFDRLTCICLSMYTTLILSLLIAIGLFFHFRLKRRARAALLATPLNPERRDVIESDVPILHRLPSSLRQKLEGKINLFLDQVKFHGCGGLQITEKVKLLIAAQACLLVINSEFWYDHLTTVLVYPDTFVSGQKMHSGFVVSENIPVRGESWYRGPVILSWKDSQQDTLNYRERNNVVIHEFAHQIDNLTGFPNGIPPLNKGQDFKNWETVFLSAYNTYVQAIEDDSRTFISMISYGAKNHEEFFAVAVEAFFQCPDILKFEMPDFYRQLSELFQLDPTEWA